MQHQIWNYVYFIIHLNLKEHNTFNGNEAYIYEKIINNDISWFPINRFVIFLIINLLDQWH